MNENRIVLAKIIEPHGIKGLVKILPFGDDISLIESLSPMHGSNGQQISIILKNPIGRFMLAAIKGVNTREDADKLKGVELAINAASLPAIEEPDTFYPHQLVGLKALNEAGEEIGRVLGVPDYGAGGLLEIQPLDASPAYLVPFSNDFVPTVDIAAGTVTIIPPEMI